MTPEGRVSWSLSPEVLVRVGGLPVESLEELRCPATLAWAEELLAEEERLRTVAAELSDEIGAVVSGLEDKDQRSRLLSLRRDVFNLRVPDNRGAAIGSVASAVEPRLRGRIAAHLDEVAQLDALRAEGSELLAAEGTRAREALRRLLGEFRLRNGLLLASPSLAAQLDDYVTTPAHATDKRTRKVERSAISYVLRAAAKPSPFSTFTGVALGRVRYDLLDDRPDGTPAQVESAWTSRVRINVVALTRLAEAVAADPTRRGDLPVVPASGWGRDANRVRYVRRSLLTGDSAATVTFDAARDQLFFLRRSDVLERILEMASAAHPPLHRELADHLATELGEDREQCEQYVATLLDLGILQAPLLATNVHAADPLRAFRDALRDLGHAWSDDLATALDGPLRCLVDYPQATPARRRTLLADLRRGLGAAMEALGSSVDALPRTLVYEDARAARTPLPWSAAAVTEALHRVDRIMPAFDLTARHRRTLHGFFLARHGVGGRCDDLLRLVHDFHEDLYDEYQSFVGRHTDDDGAPVPDPNFLHDPQIVALDGARATFIAGLAAALAASDPDAAEVEIDPALVDAVAAEIGPVGFSARTHFVQPAGDGLVVHNSAYGGLAFPFSRFTHCFAEDGLVERLRHRARAVTPAGAVLAEVTGGAAITNLNLHDRLTDYEIVCPGETSTAPVDRRLDLADLTLEHDEEADRLVLRSRRLGREVLPVYLGYLLPAALPAISRTLLLLSTSATVWFDPWAGVPAAGVADGVVHRPRLRFGPLVLARRSWTMSARDLPVDAPGDPAQQFLAWQRWRRVHGLPHRVFALVRPPAGTPGRRPKPQLVDLGSDLAIGSLRAMLTDPEAQVVLTEQLPTGDHAEIRSTSGRHLAEYAVEAVSVPTALVSRAQRSA
jgi:hypothetical protein